MNVLVLTGAGISAESGIPTFRGADGLWEGHAIEEVATPQGFEANPELVHQFYNARRRKLQSGSIAPNAAHLALAEFEQKNFADSNGDSFLLVTQNIDNLHQRAGSRNVLAMHGELLKARCSETNQLFDWTDDLTIDTPHPNKPSLRGTLRPHVVWFGEMPIGLEQIDAAARDADVFVSIGTSSVVYPAAGIVQSTRDSCRRIEINLDDTSKSDAFNEKYRGPASEEVPRVLKQLLV